ncbi:MAG: enoyl-CoA hydratase-related protein [Gemmatimonadota bacterium]|nr:enoyl-CoA hydratase-related protein [Gemmatimonadota bacterium]
MNDGVRIERHGPVLEVTIDRPKANAIDNTTSHRLGEVFCDYRDDDELLCAILTGAGDRIFCAGWDLKDAVESGAHEDDDLGPGGFAGLTELWDLDKPVIAAINGVAVGGGFELALACDLIVAVEGATFSLPETAIGVAADAGGIQRLPRRIPHHIAMDMLLTGRKMNMQEAVHWGLVNYVVDREDLRPKVYDLAHQICDGAPLSIRAIKEILRGIDGMSEREAFEAVNRRDFPTHQKMLHSEDHEEGPRAFVEKRKPNWKGR